MVCKPFCLVLPSKFEIIGQNIDGKTFKVDDYDGETVQKFIDFIYDGQIKDTSRINIQLLAISHQYQVLK